MKIVADQKEHEVQYQQVPPQIIDRKYWLTFPTNAAPVHSTLLVPDERK